jgi:CRP/FNR family cyclic AMP-dependent transcriptional regulator
MSDVYRYQSRLSQGHWFSTLPVALQDALLDAAQVQHLAAGQALFRRGDKPSGLYGACALALSVRPVKRPC